MSRTKNTTPVVVTSHFEDGRVGSNTVEVGSSAAVLSRVLRPDVTDGQCSLSVVHGVGRQLTADQGPSKGVGKLKQWHAYKYNFISIRFSFNPMINNRHHFAIFVATTVLLLV